MHTRKLRYFIAVAEELHFSRAAARLFLAQQALSRQIRELEEELGIALFIRSTRKVELTSAGQVFLEGARAALSALDGAVIMAVRANRALTGTLRLGFFPGAALELTEPIISEFRSRYPEVCLELRESTVQDPSSGIRDGGADLAIIRTPMDDRGLTTEPLFSEPVVVAVAVTHPLASRTAVLVRDLLDEPMTLSDNVDAIYRAFWSLDAFRDGVPPRTIVASHSVTEEVQLVATGAAVAITSAGAARYVQHPGIRYLAVTDAPRSTVSLAWRDGEESALIRHFRQTALAVRDRESATVRLIEQLPDPTPTPD